MSSPHTGRLIHYNVVHVTPFYIAMHQCLLCIMLLIVCIPCSDASPIVGLVAAAAAAVSLELGMMMMTNISFIHGKMLNRKRWKAALLWLQLMTMSKLVSPQILDVYYPSQYSGSCCFEPEFFRVHSEYE